MKNKNIAIVLLLFVCFLAPLSVLSVGTFWIGISVLGGLFLVSERGFLRTKELSLSMGKQFFSSENDIGCSKRQAIGLFVLLTAVAFGLQSLYFLGFTDNGIIISGVKILPTWTLLFYPAIGILFLRKQKVKFRPVYLLAFVVAIILFVIQYFQSGVQTGSAYEAGLEIWYSIFVAAICEELYFRAALYPCAAKAFGKIWGSVISSLLFALWHFGLTVPLISHFSTVLATNLANIFILGIVTSIIYEGWGVSYSILFHAVNNGLVLYLLDCGKYIIHKSIFL